MQTTQLIPFKDLKLDLSNFRTIPQADEATAVRAMVSISPDWFWALTESLLDAGYEPTENIIVLKLEKQNKMIVKEGNRRIGAMKLIVGLISAEHLPIPDVIKARIKKLTAQWRTENAVVPCAVYQEAEAATVDRLVTRTHGKGEKAGRDNWNAVAKARHNRDKNGGSEPSLDLLENYLKNGKNLTPEQSERWSGVYPLSVLEEAIKRLAPRIGASSSRILADSYPASISHRPGVEGILRDIGLGTLGFNNIRDLTQDFMVGYGVPAAPSGGGAGGSAGGSGSGSGGGGKSGAAGGGKKSRAAASNDPRTVIRTLKKFTPCGNNREKVVTLLEEARRLKLHKHAHAFCFVLRSMFEISAKAYCTDNKAAGLSSTKADKTDRALVDVLRDVTNHLTKSGADKAVQKELHGAIAELARPNGFLSVTSMNQLVHNPKFTVDETHISTLFSNVFPLLDHMNR